MRLSRVLVSAGLLFIANAAFAINNGGFEFPEMPPGTFVFQPVGSGWNMSSTVGIAFGNTTWAPSSHTGNQYAFLSVDPGGTATMSQTMTGLTVGQLYRVQYWQARPGFLFTANASSVAVSIGGTEVVGGSVSINDVWSAHETPVFRATATSEDVLFTAYFTDPTQASAAVIDDVSLVPVTDTLADLNGSFELPVIPSLSWNYGCSGVGSQWHFSGQQDPSSGAGIASVPSMWAALSGDGNQIAFVQRAGYMERVLNGLLVGHPYTVHFKMSRQSALLPGPQANVLIDGVNLLTGLAPAAPDTWEQVESQIFVPTSSPAVLRFQGIDVGADRSMLFDSMLVDPVDFADFTITPSGIVCGNTAMGHLTISRPAPPGGATINLLPSSAFIKTPPSVTIAEGQVTADFAITTGVNTVTTMKQVQARFGLLQKTRNIVVIPADLSNVSISPGTIVGGNGGTGTVTANGTAAANFTVNLASSGPQLIVPASVTIPITKKQATFSVSTLAVTGNVTRYITATRNGRSRTATVLITP